MVRLGIAIVIALVGVVQAQVPHAEAMQRVSHAKKLLSRTQWTNPEQQQALRAVVDAIRNPPVKPDPRELAKFRSAAVRVFLAGLQVRFAPDDPREPVRWLAARSLRHCGPESFDRIRRDLESNVLRGLGLRLTPRVWEALCDSLLAIDLEAGYRFVVEEMVNPNVDLSSTRRTHAVVLALLAAPLPKAGTRRIALKRILAQFQQFPFHVEADYDYVADFRNVHRNFKQKLRRHGEYWAEMRPLVIQLLRRLTANPVTGELAKDVDSGLECETLPRFKVWNGRYKGRPIAQWKKEPRPQPRTTLRYVRPEAQGFFLRWTVPWTTYWHLDSSPLARDRLKTERKALREVVLPPLLRAALKDPDPIVRASSAVGATHLRMNFLAVEKDERVREAAAWGMLQARDPKWRDAWRAMVCNDDENPQIRAMGVLALGLLGDALFVRSRFAEDAEPWSKDKTIDCELRACAVVALGWAGGAGDAPLLLKLLLDSKEPPAVFGSAATALARIGTPAEADPLLARLRKVSKKTGDPARAAAVARALAGVIAPTDEARLQAAARVFLKKSGTFAGHRTETVRALGRIGGPHVFKLLQKGHWECREDGDRSAEFGFFLLAIGKTDAAFAEQFLAGELERLKSEYDASAAVLALAERGAIRRGPEILARMEKARRIYIRASIDALGRLRDAAALPTIRARLRTEHRDLVVPAAALAIARIRGAGAGAELETIWPRCADWREFDAVASAFGICGPDGSETQLRARFENTARPPLERAYALAALVRMADPSDETRARLRDAYFPYGAPRMLTALARFGDSFFLARTDD